MMRVLFDKTEVDARFAKTVYIVAAKPYECLMIWEQYHRKLNWKQDNSGLMYSIGMCDNMSVDLHFRWEILNKKYVLFYETISLVSDDRLIEQFLTRHCKAYANRKHCDAMNFHNCYYFIIEGK